MFSERGAGSSGVGRSFSSQFDSSFLKLHFSRLSFLLKLRREGLYLSYIFVIVRWMIFMLAINVN